MPRLCIMEKEKIKLHKIISFLESAEPMFFLKEKNIDVFKESFEFIISSIKNNTLDKTDYSDLSELIFGYNQKFPKNRLLELEGMIFSDDVVKSNFYKNLTLLSKDRDSKERRYIYYDLKNKDIDYLVEKFKKSEIEEQYNILLFLKLGYVEDFALTEELKKNINKEKIKKSIIDINDFIIENKSMSLENKNKLLVDTWKSRTLIVYDYYSQEKKIDFFNLDKDFNILKHANKEQKSDFFKILLAKRLAHANNNINNNYKFKLYKKYLESKNFEFDLIVAHNKTETYEKITTFEELLLKEQVHKAMININTEDLYNVYVNNIDYLLNAYKKNKNKKIDMNAIEVFFEGLNINKINYNASEKMKSEFLIKKIEIKNNILNSLNEVSSKNEIKKIKKI